MSSLMKSKMFMLVVSCRLGRYAVESYLEQILSHGFFHADPVSFLMSFAFSGKNLEIADCRRFFDKFLEVET